MKKLVLFIVSIVLFINYSLPVYAEEEILSEEIPSEEIVDEDKVEEEKDDIPEEIVEEVIEEDIEDNNEELLVEEETTSEEIEEVPIVEEIIIEEVEVVDVVETERLKVNTPTNEEVEPKVEVDKPVSKYAKIKNTEASINGFVVRLYRNVLYREPDDVGFDYWTKGIKNKSITGSTAVKGFFLSKEMNNKNLSNEDFVKLLYLTVLNRNADKGGLKYWVSQLDVKMTRELVVNGFINSKEFGDLCNKYGVNRGTSNATKYYRDKSYNVTAFVSRMYTKVLNRSSDMAGLEYWTKNLLNKNENGASLVKGFFLSKEFTNKKVSDEEFIKIAYRTILDREADKSGLKYWLEALSNHYSRNYILKGFVNSKEFNNLCKTYKISVGNFGDIDTFKTVKSVSVSYLSQDDPRWKNTYFGEYTFGDTGCAETVLAMIYRAYGHNITPTTIGSYLYKYTSEYNGDGTDGIGTSGKGVKYACDYYGYKFVPLKNQKELEDALKSRHVVHAAMGPGIFTNPGYTHAVLFKGYSKGNTYVYDPKHKDKTGWYNISTIYSQGSTDNTDKYNGAVFFMIFK